MVSLSLSLSLGKATNPKNCIEAPQETTTTTTTTAILGISPTKHSSYVSKQQFIQYMTIKLWVG